MMRTHKNTLNNMLSDFLEIPNLSQKSKMAMLSKLRVWALGMKPIGSRQLPRQRQVWFSIYSIASFCYRWFIVLMIFWFLTEIFEPYGLEVIGHVVVAISLFGMVVVPLYKLAKFFLYPGRMREVKKIRTMASAVLILAALGAFCLIPVPHSVWVNFVVRPNEAQSVYVNQPGTLRELKVQPGDSVVANQVLAVLENEDLEINCVALEGELAKLKTDLVAYELSQSEYLDAARKIGQTQAEIIKVERQLDLARKQLQELNLVADRAGQVLPPPNNPVVEADDRTLATWSGTPLDRDNQSAFLARETVFCFVGDPSDMKAVLVVEQGDVKFLQPGQRTQLMLFQYPDTRIEGELQDVSRDELTVIPRELSKTNGGPVSVLPLPNGGERPLLKSYEATVILDQATNIKLLPGMHGSAKILVGDATLASRVWREIQLVLNFR